MSFSDVRTSARRTTKWSAVPVACLRTRSAAEMEVDLIAKRAIVALPTAVAPGEKFVSEVEEQ